jgi:transcription elongation factor S-II
VPKDIVSVAIDVEAAAFKKYNSQCSADYKQKIRSLYQNLKNKSNPQLRQRVYNGEITPQRFVTMTYDELKSDERKAEDQKLMKENMDKAMVAQEERSISSELKCGKCGQMRVSYTQAQTRSADEPMTTFCECQQCGNRWKFS